MNKIQRNALLLLPALLTSCTSQELYEPEVVVTVNYYSYEAPAEPLDPQPQAFQIEQLNYLPITDVFGSQRYQVREGEYVFGWELQTIHHAERWGGEHVMGMATFIGDAYVTGNLFVATEAGIPWHIFSVNPVLSDPLPRLDNYLASFIMAGVSGLHVPVNFEIHNETLIDVLLQDLGFVGLDTLRVYNQPVLIRDVTFRISEFTLVQMDNGGLNQAVIQEVIIDPVHTVIRPTEWWMDDPLVGASASWFGFDDGVNPINRQWSALPSTAAIWVDLDGQGNRGILARMYQSNPQSPRSYFSVGRVFYMNADTVSYRDLGSLEGFPWVAGVNDQGRLMKFGGDAGILWTAFFTLDEDGRLVEDFAIRSEYDIEYEGFFNAQHFRHDGEFVNHHVRGLPYTSYYYQLTEQEVYGFYQSYRPTTATFMGDDTLDILLATLQTIGTSWQEAYMRVVAKGLGFLTPDEATGLSMLLHDFNADGVPELLLVRTTRSHLLRIAGIFTFTDNILHRLDDNTHYLGGWFVSGVPGSPSRLIDSEAVGSGSLMTSLELIDGQLTQTHIGIMHPSQEYVALYYENHVRRIDGGDYVYPFDWSNVELWDFSLDGETTTQEAFEAIFGPWDGSRLQQIPLIPVEGVTLDVLSAQFLRQNKPALISELTDTLVMGGRFWDDWWSAGGRERFSWEHFGEEWLDTPQYGGSIYQVLLPSSGFTSLANIRAYLSTHYTPSFIEDVLLSTELNGQAPFVEHQGQLYMHAARAGFSRVSWDTAKITAVEQSDDTLRTRVIAMSSAWHMFYNLTLHNDHQLLRQQVQEQIGSGDSHVAPAVSVNDMLGEVFFYIYFVDGRIDRIVGAYQPDWLWTVFH